jgi:hypothetical protein
MFVVKGSRTSLNSPSQKPSRPSSPAAMRVVMACAPMWLADVVPRQSTSPRSLPTCGPLSSLESSMSAMTRKVESVAAAHSLWMTWNSAVLLMQ